METLIKQLAEIQQKVEVKKNNFNDFSSFYYRTGEEIHNAIKPFLKNLILTLSDEIIFIHDRVYVKSTATITDGKNEIKTSAFAREDAFSKNMGVAQLTITASSYARKTAMEGLLLIDEGESTNQRKQTSHKKTYEKKPYVKKKPLENLKERSEGMISFLKQGGEKENIIEALKKEFYLSIQQEKFIKDLKF